MDDLFRIKRVLLCCCVLCCRGLCRVLGVGCRVLRVGCCALCVVRFVYAFCFLSIPLVRNDSRDGSGAGNSRNVNKKNEDGNQTNREKTRRSWMTLSGPQFTLWRSRAAHYYFLELRRSISSSSSSSSSSSGGGGGGGAHTAHACTALLHQELGCLNTRTRVSLRADAIAISTMAYSQSSLPSSPQRTPIIQHESFQTSGRSDRSSADRESTDTPSR